MLSKAQVNKQPSRSETPFLLLLGVQDTLEEAEEHRNASQLREQRLVQQLAQNELDRQALSQVPFRSYQAELLCKEPSLTVLSSKPCLLVPMH